MQYHKRLRGAGEEWREVSTLDLVPADSPRLLLLVGAGPAARAWALAAASTSAAPGSCSPGGAAGIDPGRVLDGDSMEPGWVSNGVSSLGLPTCAGTEAREPTPQVPGWTEGRASGLQGAQAQTGSEARHCGQRPLRIHVVHVCGSAEAAAALLAAQGGARESQAGAARSHTAVDLSGRWAALREVGFRRTVSASSDFSFHLRCCGVQRMRRS